jgi:hypothetical protein
MRILVRILGTRRILVRVGSSFVGGCDGGCAASCGSKAHLPNFDCPPSEGFGRMVTWPLPLPIASALLAATPGGRAMFRATHVSFAFISFGRLPALLGHAGANLKFQTSRFSRSSKNRDNHSFIHSHTTVHH